MTRTNRLGEPKGGWHIEEAMTREEALRSFTNWSAYAEFNEDIKGSLEVGKLADFAVIDRDLMTCPAEYIKDTQVLLTVSGGEEVYRKDASVPTVMWNGLVQSFNNKLVVEPGKIWVPLNDIVNGISAEKRTEGSSVLVTLDGKSVKLLGGCIHHDHGLLGAAGYEQAEERRIRRLKEAGFNAVRISHHPASPALLRACDRTGMYVMNEAFDLWTRAKTSLDYSAHFTDRALLDLEAMVRVARSHPCVILYSIGNEIPECATSAGVRLSAELTATIRAMDATRPITAGINGIFISGDAMDQILGDILPGKVPPDTIYSLLQLPSHQSWQTALR